MGSPASVEIVPRAGGSRVVGSAAADLTAMRLLSGSQAVPHWQSENPCRLPNSQDLMV